MAEAKLPTRQQLENLSWAMGQAVAHTRITCSKMVELLEDPNRILDVQTRVALTTVQMDCERVLKLWED